MLTYDNKFSVYSWYFTVYQIA